MRLANLAKAVQLMQEHASDLGHFLTTDDKGKQLPQYLEELARHLGGEQTDLLAELSGWLTTSNTSRKSWPCSKPTPRCPAAVEKVSVSELVESALKMHNGAYQRHSIRITRDYDEVPPIMVDRHKVLQILINIFQNAKYACDDGGQPEKKVRVQIRRQDSDRVAIEITDNGIGILPENLTRIFSHGFTTEEERARIWIAQRRTGGQADERHIDRAQ